MPRKTITAERERSLIENYQKSHCKNSLEELITVHHPYVQRLAAKYHKKFNKIVEFDDLVQQARIGMIHAAEAFDLSLNLRFLTYAHGKMRAEMQNAWHHAHPVHIPAHTLRDIMFNKEPDTDGAKERKALAKVTMKSESLDALYVGNENESTNHVMEMRLIENSNGELDPTFFEATQDIYSPSIQKIIDKLKPMEWEIFKLRSGIHTGSKLTFKAIAQRMKLSEEETVRLFKRAKRVLTKHLDAYHKTQDQHIIF